MFARVSRFIAVIALLVSFSTIVNETAIARYRLTAGSEGMSQTSVSSAKMAVPQSGAYLGVWQPGISADLTSLVAFERKVGRRAAIVHWYQGWGAANRGLDTALMSRVVQRGSTPMITWEPWDYTQGVEQPGYSLRTIADGQFDGYIREWATGLAAFQHPVLIRFAHEMNHPVYPWSVGVNGNTTEDYVAAWRHVHDIFVASGATNVSWVWSPLIWWEGATPLEPLFPGDEYVDWVALDGYNHVDWGGWQSFSHLFAASYQKLTALSSKPVMIAEVASSEPGGSKAQWITDTYSDAIPNQFPRIKAIIWFNEAKEADWRVDSSASSLRSFRKAVASPYYLSSSR
jgi:beta-mannanase